ncbi:hypothetical protein ACFX19_039052 [Malus domestica]
MGSIDIYLNLKYGAAILREENGLLADVDERKYGGEVWWLSSAWECWWLLGVIMTLPLFWFHFLPLTIIKSKTSALLQALN